MKRLPHGQGQSDPLQDRDLSATHCQCMLSGSFPKDRSRVGHRVEKNNKLGSNRLAWRGKGTSLFPLRAARMAAPEVDFDIVLSQAEAKANPSHEGWLGRAQTLVFRVSDCICFLLPFGWTVGQPDIQTSEQGCGFGKFFELVGSARSLDVAARLRSVQLRMFLSVGKTPTWPPHELPPSKKPRRISEHDRSGLDALTKSDRQRLTPLM